MVMLSMTFFMTTPGCSTEFGPSDSVEEKVEEPLYSVSIKGVEVNVGETKMQSLLDAGFTVTWSEWTGERNIETNTVDNNMELEANSYYTGGSLHTGIPSMSIKISFVTEDEAVTLGEAVIARMEFSFSVTGDTEEHSDIVFNGVPITELTREKAGEMFPDFRGDDAMWFSTGLKEYDYFLGYESQTKKLVRLTVEREYDVDWNG